MDETVAVLADADRWVEAYALHVRDGVTPYHHLAWTGYAEPSGTFTGSDIVHDDIRMRSQRRNCIDPGYRLQQTIAAIRYIRVWWPGGPP